ncbi:MAG: iron-sulfur cluster assembly scaffold protein [Spirochaetes bacterium]|nr:iron-sulfur cluster assembly scaffold protein [Spirochaetota bacterium]
MNDKKELSAELRTALEEWAEENLRAIGLSKDKIHDYENWKEKAIAQLRFIYSDKVIDLFLRTKDFRKMDSPDAFARVRGQCGDTMEIYLKVNNGKIIDSSFQTDGCKPTIASGGMVAEMIKEKSIDKIENLTQQDVLNALGGLPKESEHCALLATDTLKEALNKLAERGKAEK